MKLLEVMAEKGRNTPLSKRELVQLYQIQNHIDAKIKDDSYPPQFKTIIPANVQEAAL